MSDEEYEVEALKKKLNQPDAKVNELILEIESLKDSIHELTTIFQKTLEEVKEEDSGKLLKMLNSRLETVVTQNETIAKGMVAVSDKVEEFTAKFGSNGVRPQPRPMGSSIQHNMGMPPLPQSSPSRMAPMPQMSAPTSSDIPPPPPGPGGKKRIDLFS